MAIRFVRRPLLPALAALITLLLAAALWQAPPAAAAPQLSASQTTGLTDGQTIKVTGAGFNAGISLFVALCDTSVPNGGACDMSNFKPVDTDGAGAFSVFLKVYAGFSTTTCASRPCGIQTSWVQNPKDRSQEATLPVQFGAVAAPPPPPAPTTSSAAPPPSTSAAPSPTVAPTASLTPTPAPSSATALPSISSAPTTVQATGDASPVPGSADSATKDGDSGGSALPLVIAVIVVLAAGGGAGYWFRKRSAGPA